MEMMKRHITQLVVSMLMLEKGSGISLQNLELDTDANFSEDAIKFRPDSRPVNNHFDKE